MSDIDWQEKHKVYISDDGDMFVRVSGGYMEFDDYREGGRVEDSLPDNTQYFGKMTNADISNWNY